MADGGLSGIKQVTEETAQTVGEVAKDVKDEIGRAIEQGVQSVAGTQLTPQQLQPFDSAQGKQKQLEDQQKLAEARRKIDYWKKIEQEQKKVREEEKQKQLQIQQFEEQEKQKKKMEEAKRKQIFSTPAKAPSLSEAIARTQAERSKGRGVGG